MKNLQEGMFIRTWPGGVIGMIEHLRPHVSIIKTGADGPYHSVPTKCMEPATRQEIKEAGFDGVGCVEPSE